MAKVSSSNILQLINQPNPQSPPGSKKSAKVFGKFPFFRLKLQLRKRTQIGLVIFGIAILILAISITATAIPLLQIKAQIPQLESHAQAAITSLKAQDLPASQTALSELEASLQQISASYRLLAWYRFTPAKGYYQDGQHLLSAAFAGISAAQKSLGAIQPYADVLGFQGEGSFTGGTAQERIIKIIETLQDVTPQLESIIQDLNTTQQELAQINPDRYPYEISGYQLDDLIIQAQDFSSLATKSVRDLKPLLEVLPDIAGIDGARKYLMIFQNDAEIRPTGGFMTAYGVIRVEKGTIHQEKSDDIYELDQKFNSRLTPPKILRDKLKMFYWNLRDMNFSPDFRVSMEQFLEHYLTVPGEPKDIDGIIAVDTQLLSDLIKVLGPIDVPGFGTFTAEIDDRCNCPQVIYALEDISTRPVAYIRDDRKAFLVPMMQTLILKAYGAPQQAWPNLFETVFTNIQQKHVLFYMLDDSIQQAIESAGFAGRLSQTETDYLHINDANLGGGKANLFITQEVEDKITPTANGIKHSLTITYNNPAPASNCDPEAGLLCLNPKYIGYVRLYLPKDTLVDQTLGFDEGSTRTYSELGKTVTEGTFAFQPQTKAKIKIDFTTPMTFSETYQLLIQKQPGKKSPHYTLIFNNTDKQEFDLTQDKLIEFPL